MPITPDSETPIDTTEMAAPIGEAPGAEALPSGEDMSPELGSNDTGEGDLGGDLGGDIGGGMDMSGGGMTGEPPAEPIVKTPEELLLERSEDRLFKDLNSYFKSKKIPENINWDKDFIKNINNHLVEDKGWNVSNLSSVVDKFDSMKEFYDEMTKQKKESKNTADINSQNPQQTQDFSGVDLNNNSKRSNLMKKVVLKDGILVPQESISSKSALDNLTGSIRKTKASIKNFKEAKIKKAGIEALKNSGKKFAEDFMGMGMDVEEPAKNDLAGAISELATAISDAMTVVEDLNVGMDAGEMSNADNLFDSANETMGEGKSLLEDSDEAEESPEFEAGEEEGEEEAKGEEAAPAISEKEESKEEEKEEEKEAATIMKKIIQKVATMKKEATDGSTIGVTKEELKVKVNKNDLSGNAFSAKDTTDRDERLVGKTEFDAPNTPAKGLTGLKGKGGSEKAASVDEKTEEVKIRKSVSAAVDKARLSVELAARQQLKGLIDNPLKTAFVQGMVEYGVEKSAAEAIAHNAFIDGFENAQKNIIKEAFETFMSKSFDDFVKVAEFTKNYSAKFAEAEAAPVEEPKEEAVVTAALRGTPASKDAGDMFTGYWGDVRKNYFK